MKTHLVSFATYNYLNSQNNLKESALKHGIDVVHNYNPEHIEPKFVKEYNHIFQDFTSRGAGFWLYKSWVLMDIYNKIDEGDIFIYCDVGASFINDIGPLVELTKEKDIVLFKVHNCYTNTYVKRDTFYYMDCDKPEYYHQELTNGAFMFFKKCEKSLGFIEKYFYFCKDYKIITDSVNECGLDNLEGFHESRHDQSAISLLTIKEGIELYRDPSQYGNNFGMENSNYGQIVNHHRHKY